MLQLQAACVLGLLDRGFAVLLRMPILMERLSTRDPWRPMETAARDARSEAAVEGTTSDQDPPRVDLRW